MDIVIPHTRDEVVINVVTTLDGPPHDERYVYTLKERRAYFPSIWSCRLNGLCYPPIYFYQLCD